MRRSFVLAAATFAAASFAAICTPGLVEPAHGAWSGDPATNFAVADAGSDQAQPKLSPTPDGGVYVSWFDGIGSGWDVRVQKLDAGGDEVFVHNGELVADRSFSSTQDYGLSTEISGDAYLAFRDDRFSGIQITAARVATSGATLWGPTGVQLTNTTEFVAAPGIAGTADGGAVVAWTQDSSTRAMKLDGLGVPVWAGDVVLTPTSGGYAFNDIRAVGNDVIVSFTHQTGGFGSPRHLYAQKLAPDGSLLWGASHVAVFDGGSLQFGNFPDFIPDGSGGGIFSWYDAGSLQLQSYVQRILSDGTEAFAHDGVAVSTDAVRVRVSPSVAFDATGSEITAFWTEQNAGQSQSGVYGQRFDAAGERLWGSDGAEVVPVGAASITNVRAVLLGSGAFAFWSSAPSFGTDVLLGARLGSGGTVDVGPFDVASTPSGKSRLTAVAAGGSQCVLAWGDDRVDAGDILAQNVNGDGSLGDGTVSVPSVDTIVQLGVPRPNPSRGAIHIPVVGATEVSVFDVAGHHVRNVHSTGDPDIVVWDGRDRDGRDVPAGVYFLRGTRGSVTVTRRVSVIR